jgi:Icc protein
VALARYRWLAVLIPSALGCIQLSPFETDLASHERDRTQVNIARLDSQPQPESSLRFVVISDSHQSFDELCAFVDDVNGRDDLGLRAEFRWTLECLERLRIPYFTAIGNHDTLSNGRQVYREMFGSFDYTFEHGGVRMVLFDGNYADADRPETDIAWLSEATELSPAIHTVIVAAHQRQLGAAYEDMLNDNGVRLQIVGHGHDAARTSVGQVPNVRVGSIGRGNSAVFTVNEAEVIYDACSGTQCIAEQL